MPALPAPDYDAAQAFFAGQPLGENAFADWSGNLPNSTDMFERIHLPFHGSDVKTFFQHIWHGLPKYLPWMCLAIVAILAILLVVLYASLLLLNCVGFTMVGPAAGSIAAALQAAFYTPIAAGSLFAMAQAAAMGSLAAVAQGPAIVFLPIILIVLAILGWVAYKH